MQSIGITHLGGKKQQNLEVFLLLLSGLKFQIKLFGQWEPLKSSSLSSALLPFSYSPPLPSIPFSCPSHLLSIRLVFPQSSNSPFRYSSMVSTLTPTKEDRYLGRLIYTFSLDHWSGLQTISKNSLKIISRSIHVAANGIISFFFNG